MITKAEAHRFLQNASAFYVPRDSPNTSSTYITNIEVLEYVEGLEQSVTDLALFIAKELKR